MAYILRDRIVKFDVLSIDKTEDIFSRILHERINETDTESFFLNYVSFDDLENMILQIMNQLFSLGMIAFLVLIF